eukprot:1158407-Pelagomonas_calceolata.AAC.1
MRLGHVLKGAIDKTEHEEAQRQQQTQSNEKAGPNAGRNAACKTATRQGFHKRTPAVAVFERTPAAAFLKGHLGSHEKPGLSRKERQTHDIACLS